MRARRRCLQALLAVIALVLLTPPAAADPMDWSADELRALRGLWIGSLPPLPPDPSNRVADDPRAADLGRRIFFDVRFSANGQVACATCHDPARGLADGRAVARGVGTARRNTMTLLGVAYGPWFFWDGRKDSQWAQALGPMEDAAEHGGTRTAFAHVIAGDAAYRAAYEALFGALPDLADGDRFPAAAGPVADPAARAAWAAMAPAAREAVNAVFANIGKALAAFQRRLLPGPARFDRYVAALLAGDRAAAAAVFTAAEARGLRLFIGRGQCTRCHNGPLLTNHDFHNTGASPAPGRPPDEGRSAGVRAALADPFNCLGRYSDARPDDCAELRFAKTEGPELVGAFKTPTLRGVAGTAPYFHAGQLPTLAAVLDHYNRAPAAAVGRSELEPLGLSAAELADLEAFLRTLDSEPAVEPGYLAAGG